MNQVHFEVAGMDSIDVHRDLGYRDAGDTSLLLDVYSPGSEDEGPFPGVIFIHGGPVSPDGQPRPKDWGQYRSYGRMLAASGFVAISFNHRLWSRDDLDTPASDVAAAISYVREHADSYRLDPERICIWGFSGGGPLMSFVVRERPQYVKCLVAYYAQMDLRTVPGNGDLASPIREHYSCAAHFGEDRPIDLPIFVARAGLDQDRFNNSIDRFVQQALTANACLDVANHPNGQHAFDIRNDDERTREIIGRTIEFVSIHT